MRIGITFLAAQDLEMKMDRINKYCKAYNDSNLQYFSAKNSGKDTLTIGITYSGNSQPVLENLKTARLKGSPTVLITSEKNSHLETDYDLVLYISSTDDVNRLITTTSRLTILYLIDLIYYSYIALDNQSINKTLLESSLI